MGKYSPRGVWRTLDGLVELDRQLSEGVGAPYGGLGLVGLQTTNLPRKHLKDQFDEVLERAVLNVLFRPIPARRLLACDEADITVTLPKPMTSGAKAKGRFGKQDFVYLAEDDVYRCPAGERLVYHSTTQERGLTLHRYWTNVCQSCAIKDRCTTGKERRITRWEHEHVLEAVQKRLDEHPEKMRERRETVEHPFGTIKSWMGSTHFQMKTLKRVGPEMASHVLAYNLKRVINIMGIRPLIAAMMAA
jgi:hypothetical protein